MHPEGADQWQRVAQLTVAMWLEYPDVLQADVAQITTTSLLVYGDRLGRGYITTLLVVRVSF